jgi:hypothetical protein
MGVVLVMPNQAVASGAPPGRQAAGADPDAFYATVASRIEELEGQGLTQRSIDGVLRHEFGWVAAHLEPATAGQDGGLVALASSASNVTISKPSLYWDPYARRYQVYVTWTWRTCGNEPCYQDDLPKEGNVGGLDGFGVQVGRPVPPIWSHLQAISGRGAVTNYSTPAAHNEYGSAYDEQDRIGSSWWWDPLSYTWDHGSIIWAFARPSCSRGQYWTFNAKMAHTWDSTKLTSFSVSYPLGITATFSSSSDRWFAAGPTPYNWYPCGK